MDFDYILKRLKFDKKVGFVLFWASSIPLYNVFIRVDSERVISFLIFFLMAYCGATVYLDCKYIFKPVYSVFKVDMLIFELKKITQNQISSDQCCKIISNLNIDLNLELIPVTQELENEDYDDFMERLVSNRFKVNDRIKRTLIKNEGFLTESELNFLILESKKQLFFT